MSTDAELISLPDKATVKDLVPAVWQQIEMNSYFRLASSQDAPLAPMLGLQWKKDLEQGYVLDKGKMVSAEGPVIADAIKDKARELAKIYCESMREGKDPKPAMQETYDALLELLPEEYTTHGEIPGKTHRIEQVANKEISFDTYADSLVPHVVGKPLALDDVIKALQHGYDEQMGVELYTIDEGRNAKHQAWLARMAENTIAGPGKQGDGTLESGLGRKL